MSYLRDLFISATLTGVATSSATSLIAGEAINKPPLATKPDIVWIFCDELRTDALGCYGNPNLKLHTPNIDRLASMGVRFDNFFCNSPVCVPSRVSFLSGQHPEDTGVYSNDATNSSFKLPKGPPLTFPRVFAQNGYKTANFGKFHVSRDMEVGATPGYEVFEKNDEKGGRMSFWKKIGEEKLQMIRSTTGTMIGGIHPDDVPYYPEIVWKNASKWLAGIGDGPFLLRISLLQPHTPVLPPEKFYKLFADQTPGEPEKLSPTASAYEKRYAELYKIENMDKEKLKKSRLCYYAQVAWVDYQVGLVMNWLEKKGKLDTSIIVFTADHGANIGDGGSFEKITFAPRNHRVPFIISWPAKIKGGQVRNDISESLDLARTLFAAAGIEAPKSFRGRDLFSQPAPEAIFSTFGYGEKVSRLGPEKNFGWYENRGWPRRSCIRTSKYRLDMNMRIDGAPAKDEDKDIFLADIEKDPKELVNLANDPAYSDLVKKLSEMLEKHAQNAAYVAPEFLSKDSGKSDY
ncbi:MAG TPA: sulfatase-like hydrolase/transferase [Victivallales bacterium]|nr:sulfatase-like hydrolase/transferase [Victivallales bacterium]